MKKAILAYTVVIKGNPPLEVRKHEYFYTMEQANRRLRNLLKMNLESDIKTFKKFATYEIGYVINIPS